MKYMEFLLFGKFTDFFSGFVFVHSIIKLFSVMGSALSISSHFSMKNSQQKLVRNLAWTFCSLSPNFFKETKLPRWSYLAFVVSMELLTGSIAVHVTYPFEFPLEKQLSLVYGFRMDKLAVACLKTALVVKLWIYMLLQ